MLTEQIILWGGGSLLTLCALLSLWRLIAGPTVLDRVIASDVLLTTFLLILALEMIVHKHTNSIPVMIGVAATAALATVTVARFVRRAQETAEVTETAEVAETAGRADDSVEAVSAETGAAGAAGAAELVTAGERNHSATNN